MWQQQYPTVRLQRHLLPLQRHLVPRKPRLGVQPQKLLPWRQPLSTQWLLLHRRRRPRLRPPRRPRHPQCPPFLEEDWHQQARAAVLARLVSGSVARKLNGWRWPRRVQYMHGLAGQRIPGWSVAAGLEVNAEAVSLPFPPTQRPRERRQPSPLVQRLEEPPGQAPQPHPCSASLAGRHLHSVLQPPRRQPAPIQTRQPPQASKTATALQPPQVRVMVL